MPWLVVAGTAESLTFHPIGAPVAARDVSDAARFATFMSRVPQRTTQAPLMRVLLSLREKRRHALGRVVSRAGPQRLN